MFETSIMLKRAALMTALGLCSCSAADAGVQIVNPSTNSPSSSFSVGQAVGVCSGYTAKYVNSSGQVVTPSTNKTVSLTFSSGSGQFYGPNDSACSGAPVSSIEILKSENSKRFFLKFTSAQTALVHAQTSSGGSSIKTNMSVIVTGGSSGNAPNAPSNLMGAAASSSSIQLSWNDNSSDETAFILERALGSGAFSQVASLASNSVNYTDANLLPNTSYSYQIKAINGFGSSAVVRSLAILTPPVSSSSSGVAYDIGGSLGRNQVGANLSSNYTEPNTIPAVASGMGSCLELRAAYVSNGANIQPPSTVQVQLSGNTIFYQYADANGNCQVPLNQVPIYGAGTGFIQTGKFFYIKANPGTYTLSGSISGMTEKFTLNLTVGGTVVVQNPPNAPGSFSATAMSSSQISLNWLDQSNDETGFKLYRAASGGAFNLIATLGMNQTSYQDSGLAASTSYQYKMEAFNSAGSSSQVGPISATTSAGPVTGNPGIERGLWVWRESDWMNNVTNRTTLFNYAIQNGFTVLYTAVESDLTNNLTNLRAFVEAGAALGLKFRFLLGASGAITNTRAVAFLANTSNLKNSLSPAGQNALQGVQYDVETYISGAASDLAPIAMAVRSAQQASYRNVLVDFCIPRWFDGQSYNGVRLSNVIQDNSDMVTLMDYVDVTSSIINDAQTEVNYATATGKKVVVGVETLCTVGAGETFCQEGRAALENALTTVKNTFSNSSGYGGNAIHYYDSLKALGP